MKYFVRIDGKEHVVLLDADGVHVDGEDVAATVSGVNGTPVRTVTIGHPPSSPAAAAAPPPRLSTDRELAGLAKRLSALVDNTPLAVVEWNADFQITRWSGHDAWKTTAAGVSGGHASFFVISAKCSLPKKKAMVPGYCESSAM